MGWISKPYPAKPTKSEMNRFIDQQLQHERCRIIDRSGWLDYGKRQWVLLEVDPAPGHETVGKTRLIVMVRLEYRQGQLFYREDSEEVGPNQADCPRRLMQGLEGFPPLNSPYSASWRQRVQDHQAAKTAVQPVLRRIRSLDRGQQVALALQEGTVVKAELARHRSKNVPAYWNAQNHCFYRIRWQSIDVAATLKLWDQAPALL